MRLSQAWKQHMNGRPIKCIDKQGNAWRREPKQKGEISYPLDGYNYLWMLSEETVQRLMEKRQGEEQ